MNVSPGFIPYINIEQGEQLKQGLEKNVLSRDIFKGAEAGLEQLYKTIEKDMGTYEEEDIK